MLLLFLSCIGIYLFLCFVILYGLSRRPAKAGETGGSAPATPLFISVVLPARNEAHHIGNALVALSQQEYDKAFYEVIVVDDRSTDGTGKMAQSRAGLFSRFSLVRVEEADRWLFGKQNAVDKGVRAARGDCIVQMDADCVPAPGFLKAYATAFADGASFAFSRTALEPAATRFERFQAADLDLLFFVAAGCARLGVPLSCMGNNAGFMKGAYLSMGGYPELGPSPVEDFQLLTAFRKKGLPVRFIEKENPLVKTRPVDGWKAFLLQRVRWARGSLLLNPGINILTVCALAVNALTLIFLLGPVFGLGWGWQGVMIACVKIAADLGFFSLCARYWGRKWGPAVYAVWETYFLLMPVLMLVLMIVVPQRKWR
jgi:cellulose synthase/poly-beta-1,6-N-acetylglucosamine synthase-like glycosyltransferase